jgi:aspartyl-tRNA synthetase
MVAGMERYYQIARCYRDEDFRADRQPEFTQLDIEMSFVTQDDVIELGEAIVAALWRELAEHEITTPIPRLTWHEAMARYGSDKPDLRYGVELTDLCGYLRGTGFRVFAAAIDAGGYVGAVVMPGGAAQTRRELDGWQDWAKARGARGLAYVVLDAETGEARGPSRRTSAPSTSAAWPTRSAPSPATRCSSPRRPSGARRRNCSARPGRRSRAAGLA